MFITRVSDGTYLYFNTAGAEIFGLSVEELVGRSSREFYYYPSDRKRLLAELRTKGSVQNMELRFKRADGSTVWVLDSVIWIKYRGEDALLSTVIDITENKRTEKSLRENQEALAKAHDELELRVEQRTEELRRSNAQLRNEEAKLREILENSPIGVAISTRKRDDTRTAGDRLLVNSALVRMFGGTDRESFIKAQIDDSWVDLDQLAAVEKTFKDGRDLIDFEAQRRRMDGTTWWVSMHTRPIEFGDQDCTMIWHFDITERKKTEEALRESEERFRRAIVEAPIPIIMHAEDGEVLVVSKKWTDLSGYSLADIPKILDWTEKAYGGDKHHRDRQREVIGSLYNMEEADQHEAYITTASGERRLWEVRDAPLGRLADGRRFVISMIVDLTDRKRVEEALKESEGRFRAIGEASQVPLIITRRSDGNILYPTFPIYHPNSWKSYHFPTAKGTVSPYAAIRWHDFGNRPALGRPLGHFSRHPDTPLLSLSPRRRFPRPTPERVFVADHQSSSGFSGTGPSAPPPQPIGT